MLRFCTQRMQGWLRAFLGKTPEGSVCLRLPGICRAAASRHSLLFADAQSKPWGEVLPQKGSQRNRSASWPSWLESPFPPALIQTPTGQNGLSELCSLHLQEEEVLGRLFSTSSSSWLKELDQPHPHQALSCAGPAQGPLGGAASCWQLLWRFKVDL